MFHFEFLKKNIMVLKNLLGSCQKTNPNKAFFKKCYKKEIKKFRFNLKTNSSGYDLLDYIKKIIFIVKWFKLLKKQRQGGVTLESKKIKVHVTIVK